MKKLYLFLTTILLHPIAFGQSQWQWLNPHPIGRSNGRIPQTLSSSSISFTCPVSLSCITFLNSRLGFAGSQNSSILKTVDGGNSWAILILLIPAPQPLFLFLKNNHLTLFFQHRREEVPQGLISIRLKIRPFEDQPAPELYRLLIRLVQILV